jgi:hypothetical protein
MLRSLPLVLAVVALPTLLGAQVTTVDEGAFTVSRGGTRIGREEFRIVRQPAGGQAQYVARALASYGDRRISPALQTDAAGTPMLYQVEVRGATGVEERLTGQVDGSRFRAQLRTPRGEAAREYMTSSSTLILDAELYHQMYFLSLGGRAEAGSVPVLVPRLNRHGAATVARGAPEPVVIAGRSIPAAKLTVTLPGGGRREVWVDAAGRVLRVSVPEEGIVANRDDPPR